MVGRSQNSQIYSELQFTSVKINNKKYAALCQICEKYLSNTAVSRLKAHRNVCPKTANLNSKTASDYLSEESKGRVPKRKHLNISSASDSETQTSDNEVPLPSYECNSSSSELPTEILWEETFFHENTGTNIEVEVETETEANKNFDVEFSKCLPSPVPSTSYDVSLQSPSTSLTTPLSSATTISSSEYLSSEHGYSDSSCGSVSVSSNFRPLTSGILSSKIISVKPPIPPRTSSDKTTPKKFITQGKNTKITNYVDKITSEEIDNLGESIANFFFGCNIPLSVIESDHFRKLVTDLRPAYGSKLPSRKVLSTTLLEKAYNKCIEKTSGSLNMYTVLLIDGWKNSSSNSKTVVSMLHNSSGSQAFLNAWDLTGEAETGDKLTEIVNESIQLAKSLYNTTVYAVVSDNASAMVKMGRTVEIWHSNCNSHTANLLAKDVVDDDCTKKVISILREFKNCDFEKALIDQKGSRIKLPADTRWCSYRDSYSCLIKNLQIMKLLIVNDPNFKRIKQNVKSLVFDDDFADQVKQYILLFDPICTLINRTQSIDCSAAEATHLWFHLKFPLEFAYLNPRLEHRRTMAQNIYTLTAFYLHPFYHKDSGVQFSATQMNQVQEFLIYNLDGEGLASLHQFIENDGIFKPLKEKKIPQPIAFWHMAKPIHPNLSDLAIKLLQLPASSAQIERVFSNWSYVHSQIRNRLTFDRSKKLLHVYYSLKIIDSNNSDEY